ncbi:MAG: ABC transporter substrate-binding protein [Desulfurellaceae bacterium]|nr:ABC transporter substrate-binding protein [Desulfurellaceae bacterium]
MGLISEAAFRLAVLVGLVGLAACSPAEKPQRLDQPKRIISLDYCADQYVLKLAPREHILAVSPDAEKTFSYMRGYAKGLRQIRPQAEDVLVLQPDLVVRSYGGGPNVTAFVERIGTPVLQIDAAHDLDGVRNTIAAVAEGLGQQARGAAVIAEMDARLAALRALPDAPAALYTTPAGVTSGPGTLVHEMLRAAGLANFQREPGWRSLPLERLAHEQPDLVAAVIWGATNHDDNWSAARHPIARQQLRERPVVSLEGAWVACGGWFLLDAIEALAVTGRGEAP